MAGTDNRPVGTTRISELPNKTTGGVTDKLPIDDHSDLDQYGNPRAKSISASVYIPSSPTSIDGLDRQGMNNSGFRVDQYLKSGQVVVNEEYVIDRFIVGESMAGAITFNLNDLGNGLFGSRLTASTSETARMYLNQKIVDETALYYAGKEATVKARFKSNSATPKISIFNQSTLIGESTETHTGGGEFEDYRFTLTIPPGTTMIQVVVGFTDGTTSVSIGSGDYIELSEVMLSLGNVDLPFVIKDFSAELLECQRYAYRVTPFCRIRAGVIAPNTITFAVPCPAKIRGVPTVVGIEGATEAYEVRTIGDTAVPGFVLSVFDQPDNIIQISATKSGHGMTDAVLAIRGKGVLLDAAP